MVWGFVPTAYYLAKMLVVPSGSGVQRKHSVQSLRRDQIMAENVDRNSKKNRSTTMPPGKAANRTSMYFYQTGQLSNEVSAQGNYKALRALGLPIAQMEQTQPTKIVQTDRSNSIIGLSRDTIAYSPYGYSDEHVMKSLLAFNGHRCDPVSMLYPLGNGYRLFSPFLMRFCSQDTMSPFGRGGLNPYAYCMADPVNNTDPSGHFLVSIFKRSPISAFKHYAKKLELLNNKIIKVEKRIYHYDEKLSQLNVDLRHWKIERRSNNQPDEYGNQPSHYVESLKAKITNNELKRSAEITKWDDLTAKRQTNMDKFMQAQNAVSASVPATDNSLPGYQADSSPPTDELARVRRTNQTPTPRDFMFLGSGF